MVCAALDTNGEGLDMDLFVETLQHVQPERETGGETRDGKQLQLHSARDV